MKLIVFVSLAAAFVVVSADHELPAFSLMDCSDDICVKVTYVDGSTDIIQATQVVRKGKALNVYKGHVMESAAKAVVILGDEYVPEDIIVFKSKNCGCTRFSVDLFGSGEVECLKHAPHPDKGGNEDEIEESTRMIRDHLPEDRSMDRTAEEIALAPRALDPNGYTLKVVVYYDDMFASEFAGSAPTRVEAIMAIVDEMYSEKDTFKTELKVEVVAVEHATGENWGLTSNWGRDVLSPTGPTGRISNASPHEANLYVFLTGRASKSGLGLAWMSSVCNSSRDRRNSINKYAPGSQKGGDAYTAETIAHEMGHNLGLAHDCMNGNCAYWSDSYKGPRVQDGVECFGYMDYKDDTNKWSPCSVADFTSYINRQQNFCLPPLVPGDSTATTPAPGTNVCSTIKLRTKIWASEIQWAFGACKNSKNYRNRKTYEYSCCQPAGTYELECKDTYGDGWHGGSIEIQGKTYCDDFKSGHSKKVSVQYNPAT